MTEDDAKTKWCPFVRHIVWDNDLYKDDREEWGFAVSLGHLTYVTLWLLNRTEVFLSLSGDNYDINLNLTYNSRTLKDGLEEKKLLDDLDQF